MTPSDLIRTAEILEREAEGLNEAHTLAGAWFIRCGGDARAKMDHDEMLSLAAKLREAAHTDGGKG